MNLQSFSKGSQELIESVAYFTASQKNPEVTPLHILYKLLELKAIKQLILKDKIQSISQLAMSKINKLPTLASLDVEDLYFSKSINSLVSYAEEEIRSLKAKEVMPVHLLLALFKVSETKEIFKKAELNKSDILNNLDTSSDQNTFLSKFTIDLTKLARNGELDPVIGRDVEIRRLMQILSRRSKNNPMLIGEPGVGKTAIAEALAKRIIDGDVPSNLLNKQLLSLDLGLLVAGAKFRGEFEERIKNIIKEIEDSNGEILLFIDEIHMLIGAGGNGDSMDAANLLKPSLARGKLRCIGATTLKEYKHIEKDKALERRFQVIYLKEPTIEEAITILRGISYKYELFHGVKISDSAILAAVRLSSRYISDRKLPDKAIDLIDEATSRMKIEISSVPVEIDDINRKILSLKIEKEAILKDNKSKSDSSDLIEKELVKLENILNKLKTEWEKEKVLIQKIRDYKNTLESIQIELEKAQRNMDYNKAAELQYGKIPELEMKIKESQETLSLRNNKYYREYIDENDIAIVISDFTGIPINKMLETEKNKILNLDNYIKDKVKGQDKAINLVSSAIKRSRAGLSDANKPLSVFLFLGPTGVGKTELSKVLTEYLFDDANNMVRIDMSEYMEKHSVSKLIGAPPGYIGHESGGFLTETIKRSPYSVILFDEIEKAHPDVLNIMLQIFDEGILTDAQGNTINFKNTIIIMTSNLGSEYILSKNNYFSPPDKETIEYNKSIDQKVGLLLKQAFKPEFLNRIDDIVIFDSLSKEMIMKIFLNDIKKLNDLLKNKNIILELANTALSYYLKKAYNPQFGARQLKRIIEKDIKNLLADLMLTDKLSKNQKIELYLNEFGKISYRLSLLASVS